MQHDDFSIDNCAVENPCDTFGCFQPQFEQAVAHRSRVRHTEVGAVNFHALGVSNETREKAIGHRENLGFDVIVVKSDRPLHVPIIANALFFVCEKIKLSLSLKISLSQLR